MIDVLNCEQIIYFIESLPRVGCKPFEFIDPSIISYDKYYKLEEMTLTEDILSQIEGYSGDVENRLRRKLKNSDEFDKYLKIYNNEDFPPVVISSEGKIIDGFHRLSYFRENSIKNCLCYKGVK